MNVFFKVFTSDRIIFWTTVLSFFLLLISFALILFFYQKLPPFIPIFNQKPWGMERLGNKEQFFFPSSIAFLAFITNLILSVNIYPKNPLLSRILSVTNLLIALLTELFLTRTIQVII